MVPELRIFCGFCTKGAVVFAYSAKIKFLSSSKNGEVRTEIEILYLLPKAKHS
jgi:aerobic-type carbon monoxide dehydrogenase small subunit (CoxS/CutS family)